MRECSPPQTYHMSCITCHVKCHVSRVTCHVSRVTCHNFFNFFYFLFFLGQSGEAYRCRVCYQQGLPPLVYVRNPQVFEPLRQRLRCIDQSYILQRLKDLKPKVFLSIPTPEKRHRTLKISQMYSLM